MKRTVLYIGLTVLSLTLVMACGKQEEPAKTQKSAKQQAAVQKKPAKEPKPPAEQKATAAKAVPAQKGAQHKEPAKSEPIMPGEKHGQQSDLNQALLAYFANTKTDPKYINPHQTAQVDLNGDGHPDALVLLQNSMYFCGTGGCTMLVFKGTKSGFTFVSRSSLIRGPVLVSESKTHGWRDLIVEVSGGGMPSKKVALKYTGIKYPLNPSTLPPLPKNQPLKGTKIF
jgi:putative lipoprotein